MNHRRIYSGIAPKCKISIHEEILWPRLGLLGPTDAQMPGVLPCSRRALCGESRRHKAVERIKTNVYSILSLTATNWTGLHWEQGGLIALYSETLESRPHVYFYATYPGVNTFFVISEDELQSHNPNNWTNTALTRNTHLHGYDQRILPTATLDAVHCRDNTVCYNRPHSFNTLILFQ